MTMHFQIKDLVLSFHLVSWWTLPTKLKPRTDHNHEGNGMKSWSHEQWLLNNTLLMLLSSPTSCPIASKRYAPTHHLSKCWSASFGHPQSDIDYTLTLHSIPYSTMSNTTPPNNLCMPHANSNDSVNTTFSDVIASQQPPLNTLQPIREGGGSLPQGNIAQRQQQFSTL